MIDHTRYRSVLLNAPLRLRVPRYSTMLAAPPETASEVVKVFIQPGFHVLAYTDDTTTWGNDKVFRNFGTANAHGGREQGASSRERGTSSGHMLRALRPTAVRLDYLAGDDTRTCYNTYGTLDAFFLLRRTCSLCSWERGWHGFGIIIPRSARSPSETRLPGLHWAIPESMCSNSIMPANVQQGRDAACG